MSYFVCGFGSSGPVRSAFEKILSDIAPAQCRTEIVRMQNQSSFASIYDAAKAIPDIGVIDEHDGSWLVLVGTPLISTKFEEDRVAFLRQFLKAPGRSIQDSIDGNFAILAYDGTKNSLIAATDFNSSIPIFYSATSGKLIVTSHELAL